MSEAPRTSTGTKIWIALGALILVVPSVVVLQTLSSDFDAVCAGRCHPKGLDHKVIPIGTAALPGEYPAVCQCIAPTPKAWWQFWKHAMPPAPAGSAPR